MPAQKVELLDQILSSITDSIDSTSSVVEKLEEEFSVKNEGDYPEVVKNLIKSGDSTTSNALNPVSLLSLKNSSLLGYVTDLALLLAIRLESIKGEKNTTSKEENVLNSIVTNRVVLEKGIKSLEKKINYQLEKMMNAYHRREKEQNDLEHKVKEQQEQDSSKEEEEEEDESDEQDEGLGFKPNPSALLSRGRPENGRTAAKADTVEDTAEDDDQREAKATEKYRPPKISAAAINDPDKQLKNRKQRNLQSMDEYLQDISEAPTTEKSIGSTIINKGRDVKSRKQMEKEAEIQRYEEENFTRLPATKTKEDKRERAKRMRNEFFGEDWSMFDNNMDINSNGNGGTKKRKRVSAWERAKRKIDD